MRTSSRKVALLLFDEVELSDVAVPLGLLSAAGRKWNFRPFKIYSVAARRGPIETRSQIRVEAEHDLGDCTDPEMVLVPGGYGARRALEDPTTIAWLERAAGSAADLFAVGHGVLLLGKVGVLDDVDVAASTETAALLAELAPRCRPATDASFRASGRVVTAQNPVGVARATIHLVGRLLGPKHEAELAAAFGLEETTHQSTKIDIIGGPG